LEHLSFFADATDDVTLALLLAKVQSGGKLPAQLRSFGWRSRHNTSDHLNRQLREEYKSGFFAAFAGFLKDCTRLSCIVLDSLAEAQNTDERDLMMVMDALDGRADLCDSFPPSVNQVVVELARCGKTIKRPPLTVILCGRMGIDIDPSMNKLGPFSRDLFSHTSRPRPTSYPYYRPQRKGSSQTEITQHFPPTLRSPYRGQEWLSLKEYEAGLGRHEAGPRSQVGSVLGSVSGSRSGSDSDSSSEGDINIDDPGRWATIYTRGELHHDIKRFPLEQEFRVPYSKGVDFDPAWVDRSRSLDARIKHSQIGVAPAPLGPVLDSRQPIYELFIDGHGFLASSPSGNLPGVSDCTDLERMVSEWLVRLLKLSDPTQSRYVLLLENRTPIYSAPTGIASPPDRRDAALPL
jgi:hypothetical protein